MPSFSISTYLNLCRVKSYVFRVVLHNLTFFDHSLYITAYVCMYDNAESMNSKHVNSDRSERLRQSHNTVARPTPRARNRSLLFLALVEAIINRFANSWAYDRQR